MDDCGYAPDLFKEYLEFLEHSQISGTSLGIHCSLAYFYFYKFAVFMLALLFCAGIIILHAYMNILTKC